MQPTKAPGEQDGSPSTVGFLARFRAAMDRRVLGRFRLGPVLAGATAFAVAVGGGSLWYMSRPEGPEDVVRAYLDAIRARRVGEALRIAGASRPAGEGSAFLTAEAIGGGWEVGEVTAGHQSTDEGVRSVNVEFTLVTAKGRTIVSQSARNGGFTLVAHGSRWRIKEPFVEIGFLNSPLWYLEVNGARVPRDHYQRYNEDPKPQVYAMFPGTYTLFRTASDLATIQPRKIVLLPRHDTEHDTPQTGPDITASDLAARQVQQATDRLLDECVAEPQNQRPSPNRRDSADGCLLLPFDGRVRTDSGTFQLSDLTALRWTVVRRPVVNLHLTGGGSTDTGLEGFAAQVAVPGEISLTATATRDGRPPVTFTQSCLIKKIPLSAGITIDGTLSVQWSQPPTAGTEPPETKQLDLTCTR